MAARETEAEPVERVGTTTPAGRVIAGGYRGKVPVLSRAEACAEFGRRWKVADHVVMVGPTRHGKSVLTSQLVPLAVRHHTAALLTPKGAEPAFAKLGRPTSTWPPRRSWRDQVAFALWGDERAKERPEIWRIEVAVRKPEHFATLQATYNSVLLGVLARRQHPKDSLLVVLDDSRMLSDFLGLKKIIVMDMLMAGSKNVTMWNNYQAPRWVPREGLDQSAHSLLWRNRDVDVGKRLAELTGDLDLKAIDEIIRGLGYYDVLWIDGRSDDMHIILPS